MRNQGFFLIAPKKRGNRLLCPENEKGSGMDTLLAMILLEIVEFIII